jgi:hypothetical protein
MERPDPPWIRSERAALAKCFRESAREAPRPHLRGFLILMAWWQNGHAAACKAVYAGSIPTHA